MKSPDLEFGIEKAEALRFAASPHIAFTLRVTNTAACTVHTIILKCQVQLEVRRRRYSSAEQQGLGDLFGEPSRWGETLRPILWTNMSVVVPSFDTDAVVELQIPCTFDFNVASAKYFDGVKEGDIPISFLFSGTVFYADGEHTLQVTQIPWEKEAAYLMPIQVWRDMMDAYYPNTTWLCLSRDTFDQFYAYKVKNGIPTFDQALERALASSKGSSQ